MNSSQKFGVGLLLLVFGIIGVFFLLSKGMDHPDVISANKEHLSTNGEVVGKLPDGREVVRYKIGMGTGNYAHWIYVVKDSTTITLNHTVTHGKSSSNHVEVDIVSTIEGRVDTLEDDVANIKKIMKEKQ